jgi:hypothetical protein
MMSKRLFAIFLLVPLVSLVFLLQWAEAQNVSPPDSEITLLFLGPVGEWLYPRSVPVGEDEVARVTDAYVSALHERLQDVPSPVVIAAGWFTPAAETTYEAHPQVFLDRVGAQAALPSPKDLALGSQRVDRLAGALKCPLVATDVVLRGLPETSHLARMAPLTVGSQPVAQLLTSIGLEPLSLVQGISDQVIGDPALLTAAVASAEPLPAIVLDTHIPTAGGPQPLVLGHENGALRLSLPALAGNQVGLCRVTALGTPNPSATVDVIDLLPSDFSPLLRQPPAAHVVLGEQISQLILERRVASVIPFTDYSESQRTVTPDQRWFTYDLYRQSIRNHTLFAVSVDPGGGYPGAQVGVVTPVPSGRTTLLWLRPVYIGGHPTHFGEVVDRLVAENGLDGLPEDVPELRAAEITYRAMRAALSEATSFQASAEELP